MRVEVHGRSVGVKRRLGVGVKKGTGRWCGRIQGAKLVCKVGVCLTHRLLWEERF